MIYGSVCSGIEAATVAWHPLGWKAAFFSEIEKFPREVLSHHYPEIPLHGDFTTIGEKDYGSIDLLVGGTPCQSFSIAGLRSGMDDDRGNLALEYLKLAKRKRPRWLVWENVPGVRSSWSGEPDDETIAEWEERSDFACFLEGISELGYGYGYRSLDAQYSGLAQRRERVFVVAYLGDWRPAAAVLFESESLRGDIAPSREKKQDVAGTITSGADRRRGAGIEPEGLIANPLLAKSNLSFRDDMDTYVTEWPAEITSTLNAHFGEKMGLENQHVNQGCPLFVPGVLSVHGTQDPNTLENLAHALGRNSGQENAIAFAQNSRDEVRLQGGDGQISGALGANEGMKQRTYIASSTVRRLMPIECERLQGFKDNYTRIPRGNKPAELCADGPRYKALGNSMAVPVMHWIGSRIDMVDKLL